MFKPLTHHITIITSNYGQLGFKATLGLLICLKND